jgi:hypothetical protein
LNLFILDFVTRQNLELGNSFLDLPLFLNKNDKNMSYDNVGQSLKERIASWHLRRKMFWILGILAFFFLIYSLVILYFPYSEGTRSGVMRKLSKKGYVFKTWEGELQMSGIPSPVDMSQLSTGGNIWNFSVAGSQDGVIKSLQDAEAKGARVTVHYIQHLRQLDWRGETVYFIDNVTVAPQ